jgi:phosphoribosylglycinamide formyltransferase 1
VTSPPASAAGRRIAVLASGRGSNLDALLRAIDADPDFGGEVVVVGSDVADAPALQIARARGIATAVEVPGDHPDRPAWESALVGALEVHGPEVVVLAGFMRILSGWALARWPGRVVNTHPSLLPAFRGAHAVRDALEYGVKVTGATVHFVDVEVDGGAIIAQEPVEVRPDDTEERLHARIRAVEHRLLPECVRLLCHGRLRCEGRRVHLLPVTGDPAINESEPS